LYGGNPAKTTLVPARVVPARCPSFLRGTAQIMKMIIVRQMTGGGA
jgi:hypothetical protein